MRLFVAIDLDDDARRAVAAEQARLRLALGSEGGSSARWVRPEHMHLTLSFLGEVVDAVRGAAVVDALHADIDAEPFSVIFAGLGLFPSSGAPSVLWLGLGGGSREVVGVQRHVVERLQPLGIAHDGRAYHPHLTLARWRATPRADRRRALAADRGAEIARVDVSVVTLYQSHLSTHGPRHVALAQARLRPRGTRDSH